MILRKKLYAKRRLKIPRPEFYLFYNGLSSFPEKTILRLSDCFEDIGGEEIYLELKVKVYNINEGCNKKLLEKNRDLGEYAKFVEVVRGKQSGLSKKEEIEEAFRLAIEECIEHNILREFLEKHRGEVMRSILRITREEYVEILVEEAREEGSTQAKLETAQKLKAMGLPVSQISEATNLSIDEIEKL